MRSGDLLWGRGIHGKMRFGLATESRIGLEDARLRRRGQLRSGIGPTSAKLGEEALTSSVVASRERGEIE